MAEEVFAGLLPPASEHVLISVRRPSLFNGERDCPQIAITIENARLLRDELTRVLADTAAAAEGMVRALNEICQRRPR